MKLSRNDIFAIAKTPYKLIGDETDGYIDYFRWVDFIDLHSEDFIWKENTKSGMEILQNIENVPEKFRERVLISLKKSACYKEFDSKKGYYNIHLGFNFINNRINIGFERTPKPEDLRFFLEMACYLDALLLKNGNKIIDERVIESLE
jgi:hypothetical protein